ncbi:site-specific integrase [Aneurinibacillus thermoaerophilus]
MPKNIASLAKAPRPETTDIKTWTLEQANYFLEAMKGNSNFIIYLLAIYTGMRRGEILALRWQNCNFDEKKISIRQTLYRTGASKLQFQEPKTRGSKRVISLSDYAVACLRKHKAEQKVVKMWSFAYF